MTLSPAETCRAVADIIDFESERFDFEKCELQSDCGTVACIAGHTALLHQDGMDFLLHQDGSEENASYIYTPSFRDGERQFFPDHQWRDRQARRIGLTEAVGEQMFYPTSDFWQKHNKNSENLPISKVLRQLEKELEDRDSDDLIDEEELEKIAVEAFA